jgi:sodium-independent sulfate anion transporter 11
MVRITKSRIQNVMADFKQNGLSYTKSYLKGLFPILDWLPNYSPKQFLVGDMIAGLTIGLIVIPQSLIHARLAGVPLEHGLYTSFFGVIAYAFFSTSKV